MPSDKEERAMPLTPTKEMIEAGAQRLVRWENGTEKWPEAWSALDVRAARNDAERCWRSMWLAAPLPELQPLSGETPRTENGEWPTPKHAQEIVFEGRGCVVMAPEEYETLYEHARQLERELYVSQNDLGRVEESDRQARDTIDDLRQQLAEAQNTAAELIVEKKQRALDDQIGVRSTSGAIPREPTEAMLKQGGEWWYSCLHNLKSREENAEIIWLAMYDAFSATQQTNPASTRTTV